MFAPEREWVRSMADALRPMSVDDGVYVNGMTDFDALSPLQAAYGPEKYARLADIKTKYDPHNVFRHNANIHLARPAKAHSRRAEHGCEPASLR